MPLHQRQGLAGTVEKGAGEVFALGRQHLGAAFPHVDALPAWDFGRGPRCGQAARHFRADGNHATFSLPRRQLIERAAGPAVIAHLVPEQAAADQNLFHV